MSSKIISAIAASAALALNAACMADFFFSTGQTGAQVQCDTSHTQSWSFHVTQDVAGVMGANLYMKRGSQTSADVTFRINEITSNGDIATATTLLSVTLHSSAFTQQFGNVIFQGAPITLLAGHSYSAVLSSMAPNAQSKAYFIKNDALKWIDAGGNAALADGSIEPGAAPAPSTVGLLGCGLLIRRRRAMA